MQITDDSAKFQTIISLTTEKDAWGAKCGVYCYLLLLSLATKFQPSMYLEQQGFKWILLMSSIFRRFYDFFSESATQVNTGHLYNSWIVIH